MGYDPGEARDDKGKWSAGAAAGDHQAEQPRNKSLRKVPGHGLIARNAPVARHNGVESVGTDAPLLTQAARDLIIRNKAIDARHGLLPGMRGPGNLSQARDIGRRRPPGTEE